MSYSTLLSVLLLFGHLSQSFGVGARAFYDKWEAPARDLKGTNVSLTGDLEILIPFNIGFTGDLSIINADSGQSVVMIFTITEASKTASQCDYLYSYMAASTSSRYINHATSAANLCAAEGFSCDCIVREKLKVGDYFFEPIEWGNNVDRDCTGSTDADGYIGTHYGFKPPAVADGTRAQFCSLLPNPSGDFRFDVFKCGRQSVTVELDVRIESESGQVLYSDVVQLNDASTTFSSDDVTITIFTDGLSHPGINGNILLVTEGSHSAVLYADVPSFNVPEPLLKSIGYPVSGATRALNAPRPIADAGDSGESNHFCTYPGLSEVDFSYFEANYAALGAVTGCAHSVPVMPSLAPATVSRDTGKPGAPGCGADASTLHSYKTADISCQDFYFETVNPVQVQSYNCPDNFLRVSLQGSAAVEYFYQDRLLDAANIKAAAGSGSWGAYSDFKVCLTSDTVGTLHTISGNIMTFNSLVTFPRANIEECFAGIMLNPVDTVLRLANGHTISIDIGQVNPPSEYNPGQNGGIEAGTETPQVEPKFWLDFFKWLGVAAGIILGVFLLLVLLRSFFRRKQNATSNIILKTSKD